MTPYILLFVGLLLVWLEFYVPGGFLAFAAALFILAAQVSFFGWYQSIPLSILFFIVSVALTIVVVYFAIRRIRKSGEKNTFFLTKDQEGFKAAGYSEKLIGKKGTTLTECGPAGYVLIDGERYAVICRGPYLDKGQEVIVIAGESGYLIVKPYKEGKT